MDYNDLNGFSLDENPTPFTFVFTYSDKRLLVCLSIGDDNQYLNTPDDIFVDGSEFEIFQIAGYNSHMSTSDDVVVEDSAGQVLGVLCLSCNSDAFIISEMTTPKVLELYFGLLRFKSYWC